MQIYAFDEKRQIIPADLAKKQRDYYCIECLGRLRVRSTSRRRAHYFHLSTPGACRHQGKGATHHAIQAYIQQRLPEGQVFLEKPFPDINRIADICWPSEGLIFEIQCSYIKAAEVRQRNIDYSRLGYKVVWILHEKTFYKPYPTAAELFLSDSPYYFTNIDKEGLGVIYDHFYIYHQGRRHNPRLRQAVDLLYPQFLSNPDILPSTPNFIKRRLSSWSIYFAGDHCDTYLKNPLDPCYVYLQELEEQCRQPHSFRTFSAPKALWKLLQNFYLEIFRMLLESLTKPGEG
ncbi:MAG: competence protein CoiA [Chlamydiota bacterium]